MSALGLCEHNNLQSYCPSCNMKGLSMNHLSQLGILPSGMGCSPKGGMGNMGLDIPSFDAILKGAQAGATSTVLTALAQSKDVQAAGKEAGIKEGAWQLWSKIEQNPLPYLAGVVSILALVYYIGASRKVA